MQVFPVRPVSERFDPVNHRLAIHLHNDMADDRGAHALVGQDEVMSDVCCYLIQDRPHRPHLLTLHVSGITGYSQGAEPTNVESSHHIGWRCALPSARHDADLMRPGSSRPCKSGPDCVISDHPSARVDADLISTTGVPSNASIGPIFTRVPSSSRTVTGCSPSGFGRAGERV